MFLGLDVGSTSIKGGVLDTAEGVVREVRSRPFPAPRGGLPESRFEIDLSVILANTRDLLSELAELAPNARGVLTCCQMGGLVVADPNGQALGPYYSWRDQRVLENSDGGPSEGKSATHWKWLRSQCTPDDLTAIGNELRPGSAITLLSWLGHHGQLPREPFLALSLGDYLVSQWTGTAPCSEPTLALGTTDLKTGQPASREWLDRLGCGQVSFPRVVAASEPAGTTTLAGRRVHCFPAIGDQQAALLGAQLQEGELSLNVSTGSQVSLLAREFLPGPYQIRPYFHGQYLQTITHLPAGRSLNALVDLLTELPAAEGHAVRDPWRIIAEKVDQCVESDLDVNLAFFAGSLGDRGHLRNIRLENLNAGSLFLAAFRSMADNYARCAERLSPARNWRSVVLSGGLAQRIPALRRAIAERFGGSLRSVDLVEETLGGLLNLARDGASS